MAEEVEAAEVSAIFKTPDMIDLILRWRRYIVISFLVTIRREVTGFLFEEAVEEVPAKCKR